MKILVLVDNKVGSSKQSITLAKSLSNDVNIQTISYNTFIKIPNILRKGLIGIKKTSLTFLQNLDNLDLIIFSGRRLTKLALYIKQHICRKAKIISILNPEYSFKYFAAVILPNHDKCIKDKYHNIIRINGSLCSLEKEIIDKDTSKFIQTNANLTKPFIALVVGGDTKTKKYDPNLFGLFINRVSQIADKLAATLLITTSRRTSRACIKEIKNNISCQFYLFDWQEKANNEQNLNPYYAMINLSPIVIATGDSISMISEILALGKSLYVFKPEESLHKKHIKFCNNLLANNLIKEFTLNTNILEEFNNKPFNELPDLVQKIKTLL